MTDSTFISQNLKGMDVSLDSMPHFNTLYPSNDTEINLVGPEFDLNDWINDLEYQNVGDFTLPPLSLESLEDLNTLQSVLAAAAATSTSVSDVDEPASSSTSHTHEGGDLFFANFSELLSDDPGNSSTSSSSGSGSDASTPTQATTVSIPDSVTFSPTFQAKPKDIWWPPPDIVLISRDMMVFYVNQHLLLHSSTNSFAGLLPIPIKDKTKCVRRLPETSTELNVILHVFYNIPSASVKIDAPFPTLIRVVDRLPTYGVSPKKIILPSSAVYNALLSQSALYPLEYYILAAHHDMQELATMISSHLLSLSLWTITEEIAERMGARYLLRLFRLHRQRTTLLLQILMPPPTLHDASKECGFDNQQQLTTAWTTAAAQLSWLAKPDLTSTTIRTAFNSMTQHITCNECQRRKTERVDKLIVQWSVAPRTIS